MIKISKLTNTLFVILCTCINQQASAAPVTIHLHEQITHTALNFSQGGVHISSPDGNLNFLNMNGVGVNSGGLSPGETLLFSFNAPTSDISLSTNSAGSLSFDFEAFDFSNNSIGVTQVGPFLNFIDVSGLYANSLISKFTITNLGGPFDQSQHYGDISFNTSAVPIPASAWLFLTGLITLYRVANLKLKSV